MKTMMFGPLGAMFFVKEMAMHADFGGNGGTMTGGKLTDPMRGVKKMAAETGRGFNDGTPGDETAMTDGSSGLCIDNGQKADFTRAVADSDETDLDRAVV